MHSIAVPVPTLRLPFGEALSVLNWASQSSASCPVFCLFCRSY